MLIVEDQEGMRRMLRDYLQLAFPDENILEAETGSSALELCLQHRPKLVLMDIGLPDTNGIDLTARIKSVLPDTTVIIISSHCGSAYEERARAAGAAAYITKENVHNDLLSHIRRVACYP